MNKGELIYALKNLPDNSEIVAQTSDDMLDIKEVIYLDDGLIYLRIY